MFACVEVTLNTMARQIGHFVTGCLGGLTTSQEVEDDNAHIGIITQEMVMKL